MSFEDPENVEEIIKKVKECETHDEVVKLINETFPGWILGWSKKYSTDYQHFQNNWEFVCKKSGCKPLNVLIVDTIVFNDPKYTLVKLFSELLTVFGHSVRRKEEFIECKICGDALPSEEVFHHLVERMMTKLDCWMVKCRNC
jgi:hypothetical protein